VEPRGGVGYVVAGFPRLSETFIVEELLALEQRGWKPTIFSQRRVAEQVTNPRTEPLLARVVYLTDLPVLVRLAAGLRTLVRHPVAVTRCVSIVLRARSRQSLRNLPSAMVLAALAERQGIRYLHAHFADAPGDLAFFASEITGIRYGITAHAADIYWGRLLCRKLEQASLVVTVCLYNVDQLRLRCPALDTDAVVLKYAGIHAPSFRLAAPRPLRPAREIVAVGRLVEKKGFAMLIHAVARLRAEGRDVRCRIVGDGPLRAELETLTKRLGIGDAVELLGACPPERIATLLAEADVLAAPFTIASTGDRDSMPVVVKEAMAMELPVVVTDDFGFPEMVTPEAGVLVPRDDVDALTAGLAKVLDADPEQRRAMGAAGRRIVETRFTEEVGVEVLARSFDRLAAAG
jgi:glycosyltransferase involved in cell wall biosynthesis